MNTLESLIRRQIALTGPLTIGEYMLLCLTHPQHGYYVTRDPFGAPGDFVTAPEVSQMFGELAGLALAQAWMDQGAPAPFALVELGPGRGTLMADLWRATAGVPEFHDAARLHLIEASPVLRAVQAKALDAARPTWHSEIEALPDLPVFGIANEFFDALPVRQFLRKGSTWVERVVAIDDDALSFGLTAPLPLGQLDHRLADTRDGDLVSLSTTAETVAQDIATRIFGNGGAFLIIDYGDETLTGDTFQAVRGHRTVEPLSAPGTADLTCHVEFGALAKAAGASGAQASAPVPQGVWLERLGITARAKALTRTLDGDALDEHVAAHRRLTHADEMGTLFKVMGIVPSDSPLPPGLEA